jgi:chemotaxis protein methyltransferase CheR
MSETATISTTRLTLEITRQEIRNHVGVRIQQGETHAGPEIQGTYLKSCVCVGYYHPSRRIGAISHITAFRDDGAHSPRGALNELDRKLRRLGIEPGDCDCFVIGGVDKARHVYEGVVGELEARQIRHRVLDALGNFHRKLLFDPAQGKILLYKKSGDEMIAEARQTFSSDSSYKNFHDPRKRLITGASLFFRNPSLLKHMTQIVAPAVLAAGKRFHIWCAGCSNGMEAWSIAMVTLDHIRKLNLRDVDFRILGTDISAEALAVAKSGHYPLSRTAAQDYAEVFQRHTDRIDERFIQIKPELRAVAAFIPRDIREGSRRHQFEMVLCDHVFQYFDTDTQLQFLKGLTTGVKPGCFLYVSSPSTEPMRALLANGAYEMLDRHFYRRLSDRPGF